jgi:diguanylate cyclase (GGDEF)-like protein/PAS domain S-box-containing protein
MASDPQHNGWTVEGFLDLLESACDAIVVVDPAGTIVLVNAQTERLFGYDRHEMLGQPETMLVPERLRGPDLAEPLGNSADRHQSPLATAQWSGHAGRRRDGTEVSIEISMNRIKTKEQKLIVYALRDIGSRTPDLPGAAHFAAVIESSTDAIIAEDLDGNVTSWNPGAERLFGYTEGEMQGNSISMLAAPGHDDEQPEIRRRVRSGERVEHHEAVRARKDGIQVDVSVTASPVHDRAGDIIGVATIARDNTARLRYQDQLRFLADHDPLTGASSRRRFEREISDQVGRSRRYQEDASLLLIDIDGFKKINDAFGHKAGDSVLKEIATTLRNRLRTTDTVARIGGDEFAVLLPYASADQALTIAADLGKLIQGQRIKLGDTTTVYVTVSIGTAHIGNDTDGEDILAVADRAMYRHKSTAA